MPTLEVVLEVCVVVVLVCVYLPVGFIECTRARTDVAGRRRAVEFFRGARAHATFSSCIALSIRFRWFRENSAFGYGGGEIRVVVVDFTGLSLVTRSPARWSLLVFDTRARVRSSHTIHRPSTCEWFRPNAPYRLLCEPRERDFLDVALGRVRRRRSHSSQDTKPRPRSFAMLNIVEKPSQTLSYPSTRSETHPDAHEDASHATESVPKANAPIARQPSRSVTTHARRSRACPHTSRSK